jgi:hypothetical protein
VAEDPLDHCYLDHCYLDHCYEVNDSRRRSAARARMPGTLLDTNDFDQT